MTRVMAVGVRRATETDSRAAADLWLRARKAAVGTIPPHVHDDDDVRAWFAAHVVWDTEPWIAEDGDQYLRCQSGWRRPPGRGASRASARD